MRYTLGTAAKATGTSKSSILRAIKSGRLSYIEKDDRLHIEASELFRVFQPSHPNLCRWNKPLQQRNWPKQPFHCTRERSLEAALERMKEIQDDRDQATARWRTSGHYNNSKGYGAGCSSGSRANDREAVMKCQRFGMILVTS